MRLAKVIYATLLGVLLLFGCSGNYEGDPPNDGASSDNGNQQQASGEFADDRTFFEARVQPNLGICRGCHVPGGVGDDTDFMLSNDPGLDYENFKAAWNKLGGGDVDPDAHPILTYNSGDADHSGGSNWPADSQAYTDVLTLLTCWSGGDCDFTASGTVGEQQPLLGSIHARHVWKSFCADKPDNAELPVDPRTLVQPGANQGKAVYFNAYWQNCHVNFPEDRQQPRTCGEYRARRDRGLQFLLDELPVAAMSAGEFNKTWKKWDLKSRPDNFEQMYTLRYGLNHAPFDNPYPLPGEDPQETAGGSGQLPLGLRQIKNKDGDWTGQIGTAACFQCHGGQLGDPTAAEPDYLGMTSLGLGNNNYDVIMSARDGSPFAGTPLSPLADVLPTDTSALFNIGIKQRGQNNAVGAFEVLVTLLDFDSLGLNPNPLKTILAGGLEGVRDISHPLAHTQDTPPWWNLSMRPRKFFDAGVSSDSARIIMAAGPGELDELVTLDGKKYRQRIEAWDQDLNTYFLSLESPPWPWGFCSNADGTPGPNDDPRCINMSLAQQGAVLFHNKDLWAEEGNKDRPHPLGGNGSCAGCHGAYSPRYVNNSDFLETPALEGVAAHISPLRVIGTDRARSDMLTQTLRKGWDTTYWAYPEGTPGYVPPERKNLLNEAADDMLPIETRPQGVCGWEKAVIGYQAPPLYGIWASAPYFHNGSVPTVAAVLDASRRTPIWRRKLQTIGPVKGFDQRLNEAYDFQHLGWQHEDMTCGQIPGSPAMNCNLLQNKGPSLTQLTQNLLNSAVSLTGLLKIPDLAPGAVDKRLVYDTRILGNGNQGHNFTNVLTDAERKAIIEYLKTL